MAKLSAGSYDLNAWLKGGYDTDTITTFYGGPGAGKTNFCMLAAISQAKKGNKVIFIDTEGGFSSERAKQLISGDEASLPEGEQKLPVEQVLANILVLKPTSFKEQQQAFDQLLKHMKDHVTLIIVDGMTMLYRLDFADARQKELTDIQNVNTALTRQMRLLAEISRKHAITVLVTNQVYFWHEGFRMVGGDIVTYWSKCLIELTNDRGKRTAYLRKHRSLPEKVLDFQIYDGGIRKKGWL